MLSILKLPVLTIGWRLLLNVPSPQDRLSTPIVRGPVTALSELTSCDAYHRISPQIELLAPFFGLLLHMTAIHSHGWRLLLVRHDKLLNPTRFSLKTFSSLVGGRNTLSRCCLACSGIAGIQAAQINARKNPLVENWA